MALAQGAAWTGHKVSLSAVVLYQVVMVVDLDTLQILGAEPGRQPDVIERLIQRKL